MDLPTTREAIGSISNVLAGAIFFTLVILCIFIPWMIFRIHVDTARVRKLLVAINENLMTISKQINHAVGPVVVPPGAQTRTPPRPRA